MMLILILIPFFVLITIRKENYLLSLLIVLILNGEWFSTFRINSSGPSLYLSDIYILSSLIISSLFVYNEICSKGRLRVSIIATLLTIFFIVFIINVLRGFILFGHSAYGVGRTSGFYVLNSVVTYFYLSKHFNLNRIVRFLKIFAWLSLIVSLFGYVQNILSNYPEPHRAFGTLRTLIIAYYFMFLLFNRFFGNTIKRKNKNTNITMLIFGLAILISSQRAIWLGLIITFFILTLSLNYKSSLKFLFFVIIPLFIASILIIRRLPKENLIVQNIENRIEGVINPEEDFSSSTRLISWYAAFSNFMKNPIFGVGVGEREEILFNFANFETRSEFVMTHNYYLTVAEQRGLLGLLPLLFVLWLYQRKYFKQGKFIRKNYMNDPIMMLDQYFLLMVIFTGIYIFFWNDQPILWIIVGALHAIGEQSKQSLSEKILTAK